MKEEAHNFSEGEKPTLNKLLIKQVFFFLLCSTLSCFLNFIETANVPGKI